MKWGIHKATKNVKRQYGAGSHEYRQAKKQARKDMLRKQGRGMRVVTNIVESSVATLPLSAAVVIAKQSGMPNTEFALRTIGSVYGLMNTVEGARELFGRD